jgi:DNA-binding response OmpR family regulator
MRKKARILVVDDEQYILDMLKCTLADESYNVDIAVDGNSALTLLAERKPDLVLLDIRMPDLNGYEALELIRQQSDVPVIMLTGVLEPISVKQSMELGADDYVRKPFGILELLARIQAKLRRARGELRQTNDR